MIEQLPILSLIIFSPLLGLLLMQLFPKEKVTAIRTIAILTTLIPLTLSIWLALSFESGTAQNYSELATWVSVNLNHELIEGLETGTHSFNLQYHLSVDQLSLVMVVLTTIVVTIASLATMTIKHRHKTFYSFFLLLEVGMLGVFLAHDVILFFVFFELALLPVFFLISMWGYFGKEKASISYLIYNGIGSALMLIAFIILVANAGFQQLQSPVDGSLHLIYSGSYDVIKYNLVSPDSLVNANFDTEDGSNPFYLSSATQWAIFGLLFVGFGIKLPIVPFHRWMLRVHTEALPAVVIIHSGVLLKLGAYGLIRYCLGLFPSQVEQLATTIAVIGVVNILYGAILATVQKEFKLVLAYSSISHMGIVLIGLAAVNEFGYQGIVVQLVSHGLISALMFYLVNTLYERTGTTDITALGGLTKSLPLWSGLLLFAGMASLGLPGLSGFIGEFLSFLGLFHEMPIVTSVAVLGILFAAVYVLRAVLRMTYGPMSDKHSDLLDLKWNEALPMFVLVALIVAIGVYPALITNGLAGSFDAITTTMIGGAN